MAAPRADAITLRPWRRGEAARLQSLADDEDVSRYLLRGFPSPYTLEDARSWIASNEKSDHNFAIVFDGAAIGGIGYEPGAGSYAHSARIGYWLGKNYWGRGFATLAVRRLTTEIFARGLRRVWADVMAPNRSSARVLEKCGYVCEATLREGVLLRDGRAADVLLYAALSVAE